MRARWGPGLAALLRDGRVGQVGDVVVAAVLAATSVAAVLSGAPAFGQPGALGLALALCSTLPVAVRQRWPIPVAAFLLVANGACLVAAAPHEGALQPFISLVLAGYSVGSLAVGRSSVLAPAVLAVLAMPVFALALFDHQSLGNEVTSYVWLIAAWVVGRVVRRMRVKTRDLEAANALLAQHRHEAAQVAVTLERGRIAREVHDVIAHNVSMMVVQASAAARVLRADEPQVRTALETIATTGRQTVDEMRSLLGVLRGSEAEVADRAPQPGLADVGPLTEGLVRAGNPVTWRIEGQPQPLPRALDLSAYRIIQEALTNALKHAPGARSEVVVRYREGALDIDITDSGGTRSVAAAGAGHGLVGMRERAGLFGGKLTTSQTPDGFRVSATLPVPAGRTT
jgi:signal transduction histidine kinase